MWTRKVHTTLTTPGKNRAGIQLAKSSYVEHIFAFEVANAHAAQDFEPVTSLHSFQSTLFTNGTLSTLSALPTSSTSFTACVYSRHSPSQVVASANFASASASRASPSERFAFASALSASVGQGIRLIIHLPSFIYSSSFINKTRARNSRKPHGRPGRIINEPLSCI